MNMIEIERALRELRLSGIAEWKDSSDYTSHY